MGRAHRGRLIQIDLDHSSRVPLYRQIYDELRRAILAGLLGPRSRMPSTRALAADLGVARSTVVLAYEQLRAEGYVDSAVGSGTRAAGGLAEPVQRVATNRDGSLESPPAVKLSARGAAIFNSPRRHIGELWHGPTPFRPGIPAVDVFPVATWTRLVTRRLRHMAPRDLSYCDPRGYTPLRHAVADYLKAARAVRCTTDQVMIVSGSQQAIDLAARVLLDPGDRVWMEDPGYHGARGAFAAAGVRIVDVPIDAEGIDVDRGRALCADARLAYVTPSRQLPLGVTMSLSRRLSLLRWATETAAWIFEDDYDSEFRYASRPLASLQGLDEHQRVIYAGTFSKVMFPSLRLGYLVVPEALAEAFSAARHFADYHSPYLEQAAMADFIVEGHFERHIRRMRSIYSERQDLLVDEARRQLSGCLDVRPADAGMTLTAWLNPGVDDVHAAAEAQRERVHVLPLSPFAVVHTPPPGLLLGYAGVDEPAIKAGICQLARAFESLKC